MFFINSKSTLEITKNLRTNWKSFVWFFCFINMKETQNKELSSTFFKKYRIKCLKVKKFPKISQKPPLMFKKTKLFTMSSKKFPPWTLPEAKFLKTFKHLKNQLKVTQKRGHHQHDWIKRKRKRDTIVWMSKKAIDHSETQRKYSILHEKQNKK